MSANLNTNAQLPVGVLAIDDLMALAVAARPLDKHRDSVPEGVQIPYAATLSLSGVLETGKSSTRQTAGDTTRVLGLLVGLCQSEAPHLLLALRELLDVTPSVAAAEEAKRIVAWTAGQCKMSPAVRGAIVVRREA